MKLNRAIAMGYRISNYSLLLIIPLLFIMCQSGEKKISFLHANSFRGKTEKKFESKGKIDNYKTFEIYFKLKKQEECLKFAIQSRTTNEDILIDERVIKTYFIIEKRVNIEKFTTASSERVIYYELGKNYDYRWYRKRELMICTSKGDPLKKLNSSIYRIRFTTFMDKELKFMITINSNNKIEFIEQ